MARRDEEPARPRPRPTERPEAGRPPSGRPAGGQRVRRPADRGPAARSPARAAAGGRPTAAGGRRTGDRGARSGRASRPPGDRAGDHGPAAGRPLGRPAAVRDRPTVGRRPCRGGRPDGRRPPGRAAGDRPRDPAAPGRSGPRAAAASGPGRDPRCRRPRDGRRPPGSAARAWPPPSPARPAAAAPARTARPADRARRPAAWRPPYGRPRRARPPVAVSDLARGSARTRSSSPAGGRSRRRSPRARPARRLLVVPDRRHALEQLVLHATTLRIPVVEVEGGTLTSLAGFDGHQGVALVVEPRRWATIDEVLARARERGEPPFVLVLDSLEDPQNVGTMLRSAEACGVHGVLFPTRRAAPITPGGHQGVGGRRGAPAAGAARRSRGRAGGPATRGLRLVGADESASLAYREADLRGPLALVVGSEGHGISGPVRRRIDLAVRIPMRGRVGVAQRRGGGVGAAVRGGRTATAPPPAVAGADAGCRRGRRGRRPAPSRLRAEVAAPATRGSASTADAGAAAARTPRRRGRRGGGRGRRRRPTRRGRRPTRPRDAAPTRAPRRRSDGSRRRDAPECRR